MSSAWTRLVGQGGRREFDFQVRAFSRFDSPVPTEASRRGQAEAIAAEAPRTWRLSGPALVSADGGRAPAGSCRLGPGQPGPPRALLQWVPQPAGSASWAAAAVVVVGRGAACGRRCAPLGRPVAYLDAARLADLDFYEPPADPMWKQ